MSGNINQNEIPPETLLDMPNDEKVRMKLDARGANAADFTLAKEDHTVANLLRVKLHTYKHVKFAGYRIPHPTTHDVVFKIQTASVKLPSKMQNIPGFEAEPFLAAAEQPAEVIPPPHEVFMRALDDCLTDVNQFDRAFENALERYEIQKARQ